MKRTCLAAAFVLALGQFFSSSAEAATATSTINVSVNVGAVCTVATTAIDFGTYEGAAVPSNGDVTVTCPSGTPYTIALDAGLNASAEWRRMTNGVDVLDYGLFKDGAGVEEWSDVGYGDTYLWGGPLADTGTGAAQPHTVYGWMQSGPTVSTGLYTDVVQVTVHY